MTESETRAAEEPRQPDNDELNSEELEQVAGAEGGSDNPGPMPPPANPGDDLPW